MSARTVPVAGSRCRASRSARLATRSPEYPNIGFLAEERVRRAGKSVPLTREGQLEADGADLT